MSTDSAVILPAAGLATRLGGIPKFLLPNHDGVSLLNSHIASAQKCGEVVVVTRPSLRQFVQEHTHGLALVLDAQTTTMSETVHAALGMIPSVKRFVIGLPDTAVSPRAAYQDLMYGLERSSISVAIYPTRPDQVGKLGAVQVQGNQCLRVKDKNLETSGWKYHWGALGFRVNTFMRYSKVTHPHVGYALERALESGVAAEVCHAGSDYFDCGTVEEFNAFLNSASDKSRPSGVNIKRRQR